MLLSFQFSSSNKEATVYLNLGQLARNKSAALLKYADEFDKNYRARVKRLW